MQHKILGNTLQILELSLDVGEQVTSNAGELSWMSDSIKMERSTRMNELAGTQNTYVRSGGWTAMIYADYTAVGQPGVVAFSAKLPGQIVEIPITPGESYYIHRNGFLCGTYGVEITTPFSQNLTTGAFGGNGLFLRTLTGSGTAFVEFHGELITYDLVEGRHFKVHPGQIGMVSSSVKIELTRISGIRTDDIILATLSGPGKIWLHSMPLVNLASALQPYFPAQR